MQTSFILGLTGTSGSGKTSLLNKLFAQFEEGAICLVSQDNYYKPMEEQTKDENGIINFDIPEALNMSQFYQDILLLKKGKSIQIQEYTFNNPNKIPSQITLAPAPIILVEGLFIFQDERMKNIFDLKVFVDVKDFLGLKRRIIRDNTERGYDLQDVLYRYEHHVFPAYQQYVAPHKHEADLIIPNNISFEKGLEVLVAFLKTKL